LYSAVKSVDTEALKDTGKEKVVINVNV